MKVTGYNTHRTIIRDYDGQKASRLATAFVRNRIGRVQITTDDYWIRLYSEVEERGLSIRNDRSVDFMLMCSVIDHICQERSATLEYVDGAATHVVIGDGVADISNAATLLPSEEEIATDTEWLGLCVDGTWDDDVLTPSKPQPRIRIDSTPPPTEDMDANWGDRPSVAA